VRDTVSGPAKKTALLAPRPRPSDAPPYAKYAFFNPYNLSLLGGAAVTAAATGHWWMAVCAGAGEAIWMLFAPDSTLLRRAWFDRVWAEEKAAERQKARAAKYDLLPPPEQRRVFQLAQQQAHIQQLAAQNPSFTVDLLRHDLAKLDGLIDDFLELAATCARGEQHLATIDVNGLEEGIRHYGREVETLPAGDGRRAVAQKNLEVLHRRKERYAELRADLQAARGQMDLMENTFRLLGDDIVTMRNPVELGARLDDLRVGFDAVRETTREAEHLWQTAGR
jgi:hypothetical protein